MDPLLRFSIRQIRRFNRWMSAVPFALVALFGRIAIAPIFWYSGRTKVDGWEVSDKAIALFQYEYGLPYPAIFAHLAALGEHLFPVMLILGLGTRFAALGLFVMTMVIQWVYPDLWWNVHVLWFAVLAYLVVRGGGTFSIDYLLKHRFG